MIIPLDIDIIIGNILEYLDLGWVDYWVIYIGIIFVYYLAFILHISLIDGGKYETARTR